MYVRGKKKILIETKSELVSKVLLCDELQK